MENLGNIITLLTLLGTIILGISDIKRRRSEARKLDTDAVETLTDSVLKLLKPKDDEIAKLNTNLITLREQLVVIEEDRQNEKEQIQKELSNLLNTVDELNKQITFMIGELKRSDGALEYLVSVTKATFPKETEQAVKMRRGSKTI